MAIKIRTKGFKATDQDLKLEAHTLLVGPNGSGKTTVADAIRLAALGFVPSLGRRPADSAALMHGESMEVELTLEDGRTIRRWLNRDGKGFMMGAEASWIRQGKSTEIGKAITKLFGDEEQDVAEMLDIRELLAATPNQRAARMEQLLKSGERTPDELASAVARLIVMRLADTTEDRMPADYMQALPLVPERQVSILQEQAKMLHSKIQEAGITGAITWANQEKRDSSEGLKKKEAAAHELRKRAAEIPEPDARDIARLEASRSTLQQRLGAARQAWTSYTERAERVTKLQAQLDELARIAEQTAKSVADVEAVHGRQLQALKERSEQVLGQMTALRMPPEEDDAPVRKLEAEIAEIHEKIDSIKIPELKDTSRAEARVQDLERRLKAAEASPWADVLKLSESIWARVSDKRLKLPVSDKSTLKEETSRLATIARQGLGTNLEEIRHELDLARNQFVQQTEEADKVATARQRAADRVRELSEEGNRKAVELKEVAEAQKSRRRQALEDFNAKRAELSIQRQNAQRQQELHEEALQTARGEKASVDRRLASVADQLRGAGVLPAEPPKPEPIQKELGEVDGELSKLIAARATHAEIHAVLDQIEEAKAAAVVFTAIEWGLQRQREIEISNAGGPLMRIMGEFLKAAGRTETPFIRASQGSCAIGWKNAEGREVQIQALSGGEWCLFAAALTAAVILCRKSVLKILLVEAGETDARLLGQLLEGIQGVNREGLMTAVVMSPRGPAERIDHLEGWDVVTVKETAAAAA